jgi:aldose sugar dehydrogenase
MSITNKANALKTNNYPVEHPNLGKVRSPSFAPNSRKRKVNSDGRDYAIHRAYESLIWFVFGVLRMNTFFETFARNIELHSILRKSKPRRRLSYLIPFLALILLVNLPSLSASAQEEAEEAEEAEEDEEAEEAEVVEEAEEAEVVEEDEVVDPFTVPQDEQPRAVRDPNLGIEVLVTGLYRATAMDFLGNSSNDIIVTDKDNGTVRRIIDGVVQPEPLIDVAVANNNDTNERGLLGMEVVKQNETTTYVFLYYTESGDGRDGSDSEGVVPAGNRLYRYELAQNIDGTAELINPKLLLDLPARPGPRYNGGPLLVSQNQTGTIIYLVIGDLDHRTSQANNFADGPPADGTGGILAIDVEGNPLPNPILLAEVSADEQDNGEEDIGMLPYYFAYGIRNSFGMAIDPVTGYLWDTENGPDWFDEINLVLPGFNSGWAAVQGPASAPENEGADIEEDLVDFGGTGEYRDPEFAWQTPVGITAINFINSTALGAEYQNDLLVADINYGRIYHFDLNQDRTALLLEGALEDKVANSAAELDSILFGTGFRAISDIEIGPDGYLYLVGYGPNGRVVKIAPTAEQG